MYREPDDPGSMIEHPALKKSFTIGVVKIAIRYRPVHNNPKVQKIRILYWIYFYRIVSKA